jgi:pyridoxamine 5'-phosphate oxidase family protein
MSNFTENEVEYLRGQRLARVATADRGGSPHVVPVGFRLSDDASAIEIGGHNLAKSKKWRDLQANPKIAIVIDDLATVDSPRTSSKSSASRSWRYAPGRSSTRSLRWAVTRSRRSASSGSATRPSR